MKKFILSCLSLLMVFGVTVTNTFALEENEILSDEIIEIADEYIISEESQLKILDKNELKEEISLSDYENVVANITYCNQLIEKGIIKVKENGSLYISGEDRLSIQGGNLNATRLYWWGWHRYNDNKNTKKIIKDFRKQVSYSNSSIAGIIFDSLDNVPGGFVLTAIPNLVGGSLKSFANELERKNKGYGTIIAANWIVVGSNIKSQTKNTK